MGLFFRPDEATRHYRLALAMRDPKKAEFDLEQAIEHLKMAISLKPMTAAYRTDLGHTYLVTPMFAVTRGVNVKFNLPMAARLAVPQLEEGLRLNPKDGWARCWLGLAYEYLGQKKKAIETYQGALKLKGRRWFWIRKNTEVCIARLEGKSDFKGDAPKAKKLIQEAVEHRDKGDYGKAMEVFEQAVLAEPDAEWLYKTVCEEGGKVVSSQ